MNNNHLRVAYSADDAYVPYTGISLYSLFLHNTEFDEITVYILDNGISASGKVSLGHIANQFHRSLQFLDCSQLEEWLGPEVCELFRTAPTNVPINSYARLFLPNLLEDCIDKILYLDADSMITGSFSELWNTDITNFAVMGVLDNVSEKARKSIGLSEDSAYINAGLLLMNISALRRDNFTTRMKEFITQYNGQVYHHDQGIINGVLNDQIGYLPPQYNMMAFLFEHDSVQKIQTLYGIPIFYTEEEYRAAKLNPIFIHFTEGYLQRPWIDHCIHPLKTQWFAYRDMTIWKDTPLLPDKRSAKLKVLAWMNLHLPTKLTRAVLNMIAK